MKAILDENLESGYFRLRSLMELKGYDKHRMCRRQFMKYYQVYYRKSGRKIIWNAIKK